MKRLVSLAVVVAFFVAIPQCFGQDAEQSPAQLLEEQQLVQMSLLLTAPPTIVAVPVSNLLQRGGPPKVEICHFKKFRKHCVKTDGTIVGGGVRTIKDDGVALQRHLAEGTGDCLAFDTTVCGGHCVCLGDLPFPGE